jgi:3-deoxy-manno-octulosonate cytidylyltransferase (CMP-KDO synthetase)
MFDSWLIVIPARLASTRLKKKPLAEIAGLTMIERVYANVSSIGKVEIVVATDHEDIVALCKAKDIPVQMTSTKHLSGSDRCFEVASRSTKPFILNLQGDEPFMDIPAVARLLYAFSQSDYPIGTLASKSFDKEFLEDPAKIKVVCNKANEALYFSRSCIPYPRNTPVDPFLIHLGVYAYRREALKQFCAFPPSPIELTESLEQLRALDNGMKIYVQSDAQLSFGIDTQEDLEAARARFM